MLKESDFPTVEEILEHLLFLPSDVEPEMKESDDDTPCIDVRLQVEEDGSWAIHAGSAQYDTSHAGFWGDSSVTADDTPESLRAIAEDLRDQAIADASMAGELEESPAWHNTGGNGRASAEWVRHVGELSAIVRVMPYRCLLDLYRGTVRVEDGIPFETLENAKAYADRWFTE